MKKIILSVAILATALVSCNKETIELEEGQKSKIALMKMSDLNDEAKRIVSVFQKYDKILTVVDNANFGKSLPPEGGLVNALAGKANNDLEVFLDGKKFVVNSSDGHFTYQKDDFRSYFGKKVSLVLKEGSESKEYKIYVPKPINIANLYATDTPEKIARTGNTLRWSTDPNTPGDIVLLQFRTDQSKSGKKYESQLIPIPNTGSYSIDHLIHDDLTNISISIFTGNAISHELANGEILNFNFRSVDSHFYEFQD